MHWWSILLNAAILPGRGTAQWHLVPGTEELETVVFPELLKPKTETKGLLVLIVRGCMRLGKYLQGLHSQCLKNVGCSYLVLITYFLILCSGRVMDDFFPPHTIFVPSYTAQKLTEVWEGNSYRNIYTLPPLLQMFACSTCFLAYIWENLKLWLPNFPCIVCQLVARYILENQDFFFFLTIFYQGPDSYFQELFKCSPNLHELFLRVWYTSL